MFVRPTTPLLSLIHVTIPKIATSICCKKNERIEITKMQKQNKSNNSKNRK